jgi:hypothetical protein
MRKLFLLGATCAAVFVAAPASARADVPTHSGDPTIVSNQTTARLWVGDVLADHGPQWAAPPPGLDRVQVQWLQCDANGQACAPISGAAGQVYPPASGPSPQLYTLQPSDTGHTIRVQETANDADGTSPPAVSDATIVVTPRPVLPSNTVPPVISPAGLGQIPARPVGTTLTASTGTWTGTEPITFTYQWYRCQPMCFPLPGATGQQYTITEADAVTMGPIYTGVRVLVTGVNDAGQGQGAYASNYVVGFPTALVKPVVTTCQKSRQKLRAQRAVVVCVKSNEDGSADATGTLQIKGVATPFRLGKAHGALTHDRPATLRLKLTHAALAALAKHKRARATITIDVRDKQGRLSGLTRTVTAK